MRMGEDESRRLFGRLKIRTLLDLALIVPSSYPEFKSIVVMRSVFWFSEKLRHATMRRSSLIEERRCGLFPYGDHAKRR